MPYPCNFSYIFQATCTIILKVQYLKFFAKKIENLKILLFLICTGHPLVANRVWIKFLLCIKIFIASIGFLVNYLMLECLFLFKYDLSKLGHTLLHSWATYNSLGQGTRPKLYQIWPFQYFFGSILIDCSWIVICFFMFSYILLYFCNNCPHP